MNATPTASTPEHLRNAGHLPTKPAEVIVAEAFYRQRDELAALREENARLMQRESESVMQATRDAARADANAAQCGRLAALLSEYLTYDCPAHMAPAAGSLPHRARLALRESGTSAEEQLKSALWKYREQHGKPALKEFLGGYLQLPR